MPSELTGADWGGVTVDHDKPLRILFVRHGQAGTESTGDPLGPGLTSLGRRQAARVGKRLAQEKVDHIYCSDLVRARETADYIAGFHSDISLAVTPAVREVMAFHFTMHEDMDDGPVRDALAMEHDTVVRFANQLRHKHAPGESVVVVAHGNFIRTILPILGGRDPRESLIMEVYNTSVSAALVWTAGDAILEFGNCVNHLLPDQIT